MTAHTAGPWELHTFGDIGSETFEVHPVGDEHGETVIADLGADSENRAANAARIVACGDVRRPRAARRRKRRSRRPRTGEVT